MSEFIRAIEFDQTPTRAAMQWGSELADEANREAQRQQALAKLKADQERDIYNAYGDLNKTAFKEFEGLPELMKKKAMEEYVAASTKLLKDANNDIGAFIRGAQGTVIPQLVGRVAGLKAVLEGGKVLAEELAPMGIKKDQVENFTKGYIINSGENFDPKAFKEALLKDIKERPGLYNDIDTVVKGLVERTEMKPEVISDSVTLDPNGTMKSIGKAESNIYPWDTVVEETLSNGVKVKKAKLLTEKVGDFTVVKDSAYKGFIGNDDKSEMRSMWIDVLAKKDLHNINEKKGYPTGSLTKEQFEVVAQKAKENGVELVNPFNDIDLNTIRKKVVTDLVSKYYNEDGSHRGMKQTAEVDKTKPASTTNNIYMNNQGAPQYVDQYAEYEKALASGATVFSEDKKIKNGKVVESKKTILGTPLNLLTSGQQYLVNLANSVTKKNSDEGDVYGQDNLILAPAKSGNGIAIYAWDPVKKIRGQQIANVNRREVNVDANKSLGPEPKVAAAGLEGKPKRGAAGKGINNQDPLGIL